MTTAEYEKRLKTVNPKLHIKKYGTSLAAIHIGSKHLCRVPQGDIWEHNEFEIRVGYADQYKSQFNPKGEYRFKYLTKRGRAEAARILYTMRVITSKDISYLS